MEQRFLIKDVLPYAAEVPGTDMGEQLGGDIFWKHADCWTYRSDEATRYTLAHAQSELARLKERCPNAEVFDAELAEAQYQKGRESMLPLFRHLSKSWREVLEKGIDNSPDAVARMQELFEHALR
jgi:hypothetical protein